MRFANLRTITFLLGLSGAFNLSLAQTEYENDLQAVREILAASGIIEEDVSAYVTEDAGRVSELDLSGLGLINIPADISQLSRLLVLDISGNELTDLPDEVNGLNYSKQVQTVEYGCQVTYDGECISWGNVLVTKTVSLTANLSGNNICSPSSSVTGWMTRVDSDWQSGQNCGTSIDNPAYRVHREDGFAPRKNIKVYNVRGELLLDISSADAFGVRRLLSTLSPGPHIVN